MNKIITFILIVLLAAGGLFAWNAKQNNDHVQKLLLAGEMRKVMNYLMLDLREARLATLQDVPDNGQWSERVAFAHASGPIEYFLKDGHVSRLSEGKTMPIADNIAFLLIRREPGNAGVVEVRIQAFDKLPLMSNFKVRMQD